MKASLSINFAYMPVMGLDYLDISRYSRPMASRKSVADTLSLVAVLGAGNQMRVTLSPLIKMLRPSAKNIMSWWQFLG